MDMVVVKFKLPTQNVPG